MAKDYVFFDNGWYDFNCVDKEVNNDLAHGFNYELQNRVHYCLGQIEKMSKRLSHSFSFFNL